MLQYFCVWFWIRGDIHISWKSSPYHKKNYGLTSQRFVDKKKVYFRTVNVAAFTCHGNSFLATFVPDTAREEPAELTTPQRHSAAVLLAVVSDRCCSGVHLTYGGLLGPRVGCGAVRWRDGGTVVVVWLLQPDHREGSLYMYISCIYCTVHYTSICTLLENLTYSMTLLLSSVWLNFRPLPSIWLKYTSHRALQ